MKQLSQLANSSFWECEKPFYYKVTLNEHLKTMYIYNYGCNWKCKICIYRLKTPKGVKIENNVLLEILKNYTSKGIIETVSFVGGEPLCNPDCKYLMNEASNLGLKIILGHTNLSLLPPNAVSELTVGIKAISEEKFRFYTGDKFSEKIFANIKTCLNRNMKIKANIVFVPNFIDVNEVERVARKLSEIDKSIPFRIVGYMPTSGFKERRPTVEELKEAVNISKKYLNYVSWSLPEFPIYQKQLCKSIRLI
ncbi:MAG: radical SAM protein [Candidatus Odinarchaeia archaeon]